MAIIDKAGLLKPSVADVAANGLIRDVVGNKTDTLIAVPDNVSSAMRYLKGIITLVAAIAPLGGVPQGLYFYGAVTAIPGADQFTIPTLAGLGVNKFADATAPYRAFVFRDAAGGIAPQGQMKPITGYVTATGVFTAAGFAPAITAGDEILILHPRLAEVADILALVTTMDSRITAARAGYLDNINQAGLLQVTAARAALLDQITALRLAELDAANIPADIDTLKNKLVVPTATVGSTTANWNAAEADLVTLGADDTKNEIGSLFISIHLLVGTTITVRRYMQVNGVERKLYPDYTFDATADPPGIPIIDGPMQIHEALRVTLQSNNALDDAKAVHYDYMIKALV